MYTIGRLKKINNPHEWYQQNTWYWIFGHSNIHAIVYHFRHINYLKFRYLNRGYCTTNHNMRVLVIMYHLRIRIIYVSYCLISVLTIIMLSFHQNVPSISIIICFKNMHCSFNCSNACLLCILYGLYASIEARAI